MSWLVWVWHSLVWVLAAIGLCAIVLGAMLAVPVLRPLPLSSAIAGAQAVDHSGMAGISHFQARDGTSLAYRLYPAANNDARRIAILIHGSAGHSTVVNEIAKRLAADNYLVVAPDVRGHGESGTRGDIGYEGQLDDDLKDLVAELRLHYPQARFALFGFSSGGGFALRAAAGKLSDDFDRLVLLSPYLGYDAPSTQSVSTSAHWANPDIPRIIALMLMRRLGAECCEALPVVAFAVPPDSDKAVTGRYSYRLLTNFGAPRDLGAAFRRLKIPTTIVVGSADELMVPDKYADVVRDTAVDIKIVPGLGHMDMLHAPAALDAVSAAFRDE
jgi:pimeloyl-ACP methyl ester carboxylesterase